MIKRLINILAGILFLLVNGANIANAAEKTVSWQAIGPNGIETADSRIGSLEILPPGASPRHFEFSALRFHLGYYQLRLLNMGDFARDRASEIAIAQKTATDEPALLELGVRSVFQISPFKDQVIAVAPAGFVTSSRNPINLGLLKIDGVEQTKLLPKGPSAILCLNNAPSPAYQYQVPAFFRTGNDDQLNSVNKCRDEVQVGPRIIEDPGSTKRSEFEADPNKYKVQTYAQKTSDDQTTLVTVYMGIGTKEAFSTPYLRAVLAVDDPGRIAKANSDNTERAQARNAYIIVTKTPATLWDIQDMLSNAAFYANEKYAPHWAVNLPGENYASMIHVKSVSDPQQARDTQAIQIGDASQRQASVLVVIRRK